MEESSVQNKSLININLDTNTNKQFFKLFVPLVVSLIIIMGCLFAVPSKFQIYETFEKNIVCIYKDDFVCNQIKAQF